MQRRAEPTTEVEEGENVHFFAALKVFKSFEKLPGT
jgi:hypothetical protein